MKNLRWSKQNKILFKPVQNTSDYKIFPVGFAMFSISHKELAPEIKILRAMFPVHEKIASEMCREVWKTEP